MVLSAARAAAPAATSVASLHPPACAPAWLRSSEPPRADLLANTCTGRPWLSWKPAAAPRTTTTFSPATWATPSFSARPAQARASPSTFCLSRALQYNPRVLILDLGGSYRWLTSFLGGSYLELSPSEEGTTTFKLRPFSLPATERHLPIPGRLGCTPVENRRRGDVRSRYYRDPRPHCGSL